MKGGIISMKVTIEVPALSPHQWRETKARALAAVMTAKNAVGKAKESVVNTTGQGTDFSWEQLLPEELRVKVWQGYIPACNPMGYGGKPSRHVVEALKEVGTTHCLLPQRTLLAIAIALETICAQEGAVEAKVMESLAE